MIKRQLRFPVTKIHAIPGFDDCYLHMRTPSSQGNRKIGWVHLQGFNYPLEIRKGTNMTVTIDFELKE